jgi:hypothetical protein
MPRNIIACDRQRVARSVVLLFLSLLLTGMVGCTGEQKKQAQDLVKAGSGTSERLAKYYDSLKQRRADHLELERLKRNFALRPALDPATEKAFQEQLEALAARAQMARRLKGVYDGLGKLIDYDASGEITGAAMDLKKAIEGVADKKLAIPGFNFDPEPILKKAITALVDFIQIKQFRKNAPKARVILDSISELFQGEVLIYNQISKDYYELTHQIDTELYKRKQLNGTAVFQKYAEVYDLQVIAGLPADARPDYVEAINGFILNRLDTKLKDYVDGVPKESNGILEALKQLQKSHEDFMLRRKPEKDKEEKTSRRLRLPSGISSATLAE